MCVFFPPLSLVLTKTLYLAETLCRVISKAVAQTFLHFISLGFTQTCCDIYSGCHQREPCSPALFQQSMLKKKKKKETPRWSVKVGFCQDSVGGRGRSLSDPSRSEA